MMVQRLGIAALLLLGCSAEPWLGPAFLWTQSGGSAGALAGSKAQASYQETSIDQVARLASNLTQGAGNPLLPGAGADLVAVFTGPAISLRQAAAAQSAPLASLLRDEVQASPASVHFPYVAGQGASWQQSLRPEAGALWVGGSCRSGMAQPLSGLAAALERGDATLLLLCVEDCAAGAGACMAQALKTVQQHAASKGLKAAYAYLPESTAQGPGELLQRLTSGSEEPLQQRRLLQVQQSSPVLCNAKCQSQVKLYEAFILCAMLLSSLFTGLICMHVLGVPDRFEKPKDAGSRQD